MRIYSFVRFLLRVPKQNNLRMKNAYRISKPAPEQIRGGRRQGSRAGGSVLSEAHAHANLAVEGVRIAADDTFSRAVE